MARSHSMVLVSVLFLCSGLSWTTDEEQFLHAVHAQRQEDYQKALHGYQELPHKGAAVWYNMGRCALAMQEYGQARLFFERAKQHASDRLYQAIEHDIAQLNKLLGRVDTHHTHGWWLRITRWSYALPLCYMQLIFIVLWIATLVLLWRRPTRWFWCGIIFMILLDLCFGVSLGVRYYDQTNVIGVSMKADMRIYTGPHHNYHEVGSLPVAVCVNIVNKEQHWYAITCEFGNGWVEHDALVCVQQE